MERKEKNQKEEELKTKQVEKFHTNNEEQKELIELSNKLKIKNSLYHSSSSPTCCSKDTKIKVPNGEVGIADIKVGDLVISDEGLVVPVIKVNRVPVLNHKVLSICLNDGAKLEVSPEHPTADGRILSNLKRGDLIDSRIVTSIELAPYKYSHTYDILPGSPNSTYYANGVLIGSTLAMKIRNFAKYACNS